MNPVSPQSLRVPFTFSTVSDLNRGQTGTSNVVEISCSTAEPTALASWGFTNNGEASKGVVMGCDDGTLYTFLRSQSRRADQKLTVRRPSIEPPPSPRPASPFHLTRHSRAASRSDSPSSPLSNQAPFHLAPRSRVVSGLSPEKVEAPKNYVDFEDEPVKLKEMLRGRSAKDKAVQDSLSPNPDSTGPVVTSLAVPTPESGASLPKRKAAPRSLLSATNSPASTPPPPPLSNPVSPKWESVGSTETNSHSHDLSLHCHIIPPRSRAGGSVTGIHVMSDKGLFVSLQSSGDISIFDVRDGSCVATTQAELPSPQLPTEPKDKNLSHKLWIWTSLQVLETDESILLLVSAKVDVNIPSLPLSEASDSKTHDQSRLAMFECLLNAEQALPEIKMDKIGEWHFDGPVDGLGIMKESNDTLLFLYLTHQGTITTQRARLSSRFPALPALEQNITEPSTSNLASLPLPNPFKGMMSRSTDQLPPPSENNKNGPGRIWLEEMCEVGKLLSRGTPLALRMRTTENKMLGIAWSDDELVVFQYEHQNSGMRFLGVSAMIGILDVTWIDDDSYSVVFSDRVEHYTLKTANEPAADDKVISGSSQALQPQLAHTCALEPFQASHCISASDVLSTRITKDGTRELLLTSPVSSAHAPQGPKETQTSRVIWRGGREQRVGESKKPRLTSILPIGLDTVILGYDDGRIRRSSFARMAELVNDGPPPS